MPTGFNILPPALLTKFKADIEANVAVSMNQLMTTTSDSIVKSINRWALANTSSINSQVDKALQPFLNSLKQSALSSLGGVSLPSGTTVAASGGSSRPNPASIAGTASAVPQIVWDNINAIATSQKQIAQAIQQMQKPVTAAPLPPPPTNAAGMPTATKRAGGGGEAVKEGFGIAMVTESIHGVYEKIADVRNELYATLIQSSNLQRQMNFNVKADRGDIRPFMNQMSTPGMEMGYTRQQATDAAQTLALAGGQQTREEAIGANKAMVEFATRRGYNLNNWSQVAAGGEQAGLFGAARGTIAGAAGIENYQNTAAGLYAMASKPGGGSRGTTEQLDEFTQSLNDAASGLTELTGNSELVAKSFQDAGKAGSAYGLLTSFAQTGNRALEGAGGVRAVTQLTSSFQNAALGGDNFMQSAASIAFPNKNILERHIQLQEGLTPQNFRGMMGGFLQIGGQDTKRTAALMQIHGAAPTYAAALQELQYYKSGKTMTKEQIKAAGEATDQGGGTQATEYQQSLESLTKHAEELASAFAPLIAGFDKINGMFLGIPGIALSLLVFKKVLGESVKDVFEFGKSVLTGKKAKDAENAVEKIFGKGKGQNVYVTNPCLRICGGMGGQGGQKLGKELEKDAAQVAEQDIAKVAERDAAKLAAGDLGVLPKLGMAGAEGVEAGGIAGTISGLPGGAAALEGGAAVAGSIAEAIAPIAAAATAIAASPLLAPAAIVGGGIAAGYAITHPKQAADFMGGVGGFAGTVIGSTVNAAGNAIGGTANALWHGGTGVFSALFGKDTGDAIGGVLKKNPFSFMGDEIKKGWHGLEKSNIGPHAAGFLGDILNRTGHAINKGASHGGGLLNIFSGDFWKKAGEGWGETDEKHKHAGGGVTGVHHAHDEMARHIREAAKIRLAHAKATNEQVEKILGTHLNKSNPLSPQTKSDLTSTAVNFLKDIGGKIIDFFKGVWNSASDWWNSTFGGKKGGSSGSDGSGTGDGGSGYSGSMGGSWSDGSGGSEAGFLTATGATGIGQTYGQNGEQGVDVDIGAGKPAKLPVGGKFMKDYSTAYSAVFDVGGGKYMWIDHVDTADLSDGQYYKAGSQVGTVSSITGHQSFKDPRGNEITFDSTGPHLEYGIGSSASSAEGNTSSVGDPRTFLYGATSGSRKLTGADTSTTTTSTTQPNSKYPYHDLPVGWEKKILKSINAPVTPGNLHFLDAWSLKERGRGGAGTWATFNPFNTTQGAEGATAFNNLDGGGHVWNYKNWNQGFQATIDTMNNGRYGDILSTLRSGNVQPGQSFDLQGMHTWGTRELPTGDYQDQPSDSYTGVGGVRGVRSAATASTGTQSLQQMPTFSIKPEPIKVEIDLRYPDGSYERIVKTAKFQGVAGIHVQHNVHKVAAHHSNTRKPKR